MRSVGLYTLGCKVSQYETEAVAELFEKRGFCVSSFDAVCDVYVINTCTVTAESDRKSRQFIRRAIKKNPNAVVIAMGCYTQRSPAEVAAIPGVSAVIGTQDKATAPEIAERLILERESVPVVSVSDVDVADFEPLTISKAPRTRAYVKIEDGCESKCTYCAISVARGRVRSKPRENVIREVEALAASGTKEIVLTGIETGSYGRDFEEKYTLADLIVELNARKSCERIRLGSLAPELIDREFVSKVKDTEILAPHFHLSLQSGSDSVLRNMKRRYNSRMALEVIGNIKREIPRATFTTDLMVGFPSESEEDFLMSEKIAREIGLLDAHVFAYSKREGTPAALYPDQVDERNKRERSERLIRAIKEIRDGVLDKILECEKRLSVIAETDLGSGEWTGHSDTFVEVRFKSSCPDLQGQMLNVRPVSHKDGIMYCEIV